MSMKTSRKTILAQALLLLATSAACSSPAPKSDSTPATAQSGGATADDPKGVCVAAFQRQRTCTDQFIPALVDARVRNDAPPGIAEVAKKDGRDALVAKAMEEWKTDSTDGAIDTNCTRMTSSPPPGMDEMLKGTQGCLSSQECPAFVQCIIPVIESTFKRG